MPPQTKTKLTNQTNENISFSQFFTNLLIKVPQVDIERLPNHLVHGQEATQDDVEDEIEADIYSLEHHENVEEFKTKDIVGRFLTPLKTDKILSFGTDILDGEINQSEMDEEMINASDKESLNCTVEENDCSEEEMLDLTVTDEFTEECDIREGCTVDVDETEVKNKPIGETLDDRDLEKTIEIPSEKKSEEFLIVVNPEPEKTEGGKELTPDLGISSLSEENKSEMEIFPQEKDTNKDEINTDLLESSKEDKVSCVEVTTQKCFIENTNLELKLQKKSTIENIDFETHGEQTGGGQIYTESMQLTNEAQNSHSSGSFSNDLSPEPETSDNVNIGAINTLHKCENNESQEQKDSSSFKETVCLTKETVPTLSSDHSKKTIEDKDTVKESIAKETISYEYPMEEQKMAGFALQDCEGSSTNENKCENSAEKEELKSSNKEGEFSHVPPALKIRIFKGHSGELINENEAKRIRKRKRKRKKDKEKLFKQNLDKAAVENDTQSRIIQELPRCNWLEQKIKYGESSKPSSSEVASYSHVDELLETDSDDDYLVVDDEHNKEDNEVTTNYKDVSLAQDENSEKMENHTQQFITLPPNENTMIYPNVDRNHVDQTKSQPQNQDTMKDETKISETGKDIENKQNKHPITYMLNNLIKKIDDNKTINCSKENQAINQTADPVNEASEQDHKNKNENDLSVLENDKSIHDDLNFVNQKRKAYQMTCKDVDDFEGTTYKHIKLESDKSNAKPKETYTEILKKQKETSEKELNELMIKENKQKALDLKIQQQIKENKKIEEQLIKDIENLKNKKIKEMEDLIDIKSKKEQSMTDLEKLKSEIMKNKNFLESLKKINLTEELQRKQTPVHNEVILQTENNMKNTVIIPRESSNHLMKTQQSPQIKVKHLPDLVNHEKVADNDQIKHGPLGHSQSLNFSQDYINHLKRIKHNSNKVEQAPTMEHLYNNVSENQSVGPSVIKNQAAFSESISNNSRPGSSNPNIQNITQQQPVPQLLMKSPTMQDKYITNVQKFFPALVRDQSPRESNQIQTQPPPQQAMAGPSSITRVAGRAAMQIRQDEGRRAVEDNRAIPNSPEGSFLRTKRVSREDAQSDECQFVNDMNRQYEVRNFLQNQSKTQEPNQQRHVFATNHNFPEIRNAIAAAMERRDQQPPVRNAMQTPKNPAQPSQAQQKQTPGNLSKCIVCYKVANFLCSGCQSVYYCTVQCQSNHWLSHYAQCVRGPRH